jgi:hypothetical protein
MIMAVESFGNATLLAGQKITGKKMIAEAIRAAVQYIRTQIPLWMGKAITTYGPTPAGYAVAAAVGIFGEMLASRVEGGAGGGGGGSGFPSGEPGGAPATFAPGVGTFESGAQDGQQQARAPINITIYSMTPEDSARAVYEAMDDISRRSLTT